MTIINAGDYSDRIETWHPGCCCPLCDNEISEFDRSHVVTAHGSQYLVHTNCLEPEEDDDGADSRELNQMPETDNG